ncbi:MAG: nucleotidyltransferase domain-containing protein [Candidatus Aenigmarchaeota archaeon]|nr:nucleotidyltransferase domain-containing protein [Candidatus Aenigmarchaeota archaeon]
MELEKLEEELKKPILPEKRDAEIKSYEKQFEEFENNVKKRQELYRKIVDFTEKARKMYGEIVKSVVVFGSLVRGDSKKTSDADVWVILDDTATKSTQDVARVADALHLLAADMKDLHVQTTNLTEFWRWIRMGSPELINFLRYGLPIYDSGFIKPIQRMLYLGMLPPSEEVVALKAKTAETHLKKISNVIKTMIFDLRYAALDACQSVIMYFYKEQPDAKKMPEFLEKLVKEGKLENEYVDKFLELNKLWKDFDHERIKEATPEHLSRALELAKDIVERMKKLLPEDIEDYLK